MLKNDFNCTMSIAAGLMMGLLAAPDTLAVTFNVNSFLDQPDDLTIPGTCHTAAGKCTLRAAVMQANRSSSDATIVLPSGTYQLTIPKAGADGETNGDLNLTTPISGNPVIAITGAGAATTIIDGNALDRVFIVGPSRNAQISGVTIHNGSTSGSGGGIYNAGALTVIDAVINGNNHASLYGGGIFNDGTLLVIRSTISHNNATYGGGIHNPGGSLTVIDTTVSQNTAGVLGGGISSFAVVTVQNSTIDNNAANDGAGIWTSGGLTMINSTVSQNNAINDGGGLYNNGGSANIYNSTIFFNGADSDANGFGLGGGIFNWDASGAITNLRNSLVAANYISNSPTYRDCSGTIGSYGRNLFWDLTGCTVNNGPFGSWTILSTLSTMGTLQDNGGPTWTHAVLPGSNAIDGGDMFSGCIGPDSHPLSTDQRGFPRIAGVRCDVGALESGAPSTPLLVSAKSRKVHGGAGTFDLSLSLVATNPTTEPRAGPDHQLILTFDKALTGAGGCTTTEGSPGISVNISGNDTVVGLLSVTNQEYVTVLCNGLASSDGGINGAGSVRIGFLLGDVNQNRVVAVSDLGLVNAQIAQPVNATNYLKDVNTTGTLTVADKGITNANLTKALPPP